MKVGFYLALSAVHVALAFTAFMRGPEWTYVAVLCLLAGVANAGIAYVRSKT